MAQRQAGVAHAHREQITHNARLRANHRPVTHRKTKEHRQHNPAVFTGRNQPEERESHHQQANHADVIDAFQADAIGERTPEQDREKLNQHRQRHRADNNAR